MKKISVLVIFLCCYSAMFAQEDFLVKGKIEFERKTNMHRLYLDEADDWMQNMKNVVPRFKTDYFDLFFSGNKSLYQSGRETEEEQVDFFQSPANENTVFRDMDQGLVTSRKQIFEDHFLLKDSLRKLTWKLENETRTIAGYECRKAVTTICDSVVVVAFYTDAIIPSSGPESFHGLPGMILGIAVPRLYTTWFATKVEIISSQEEKKILPPSKGKNSNRDEMVEAITRAIQRWGEKYFHRAIWFSTL